MTWTLAGMFQKVCGLFADVVGIKHDLFISGAWRFSWTGFMGSPYRHFSLKEVVGLDPDFVKRLDTARELAMCPFIITSGKRTPLENKLAGGVDDSAHIEGLAVDLRTLNSHMMGKIVQSLYAVGFNRIGVYKDGHIHVDVSRTLPQDVLWLG